MPITTVINGDRSRAVLFTEAPLGDEEQVSVTLSVRHNKSRKALTATAYVERVNTSRNFLVRASSPFTDPRLDLGTKPIGRYSAKAFEEFYADVREAFVYEAALSLLSPDRETADA